MEVTTGKILGIYGNMITIDFEGSVTQNEVVYAIRGNVDLKAEVIRIRGRYADLQIFESPIGLKVGDKIKFTGKLLAAELGPGLLAQVFDGLQNPLPALAEQSGFFLKTGTYLKALPRDREWDFNPIVKTGDILKAGDTIGTVQEGIFTHHIMVPFIFQGNHTVVHVVPAGKYVIDSVVAELENTKGIREKVTMVQEWPVKIPIKCYSERLKPTEPLLTKQRILDTFFPVAKGGTFCIPGPFGAGKTVLQQIISRNADIDIVVIAACGERAGEVVEILREFPKLIDPRTGNTLIKRTVIICNTSSMPVAAREASVYTAITIAEYYRQMGLHILLLADSTSRWAQALREMSGRLEEIPGEEAFPAYLESVIAAFYERAGVIKLHSGLTGSVTIGGTVSPAGGNFDEPVTQATLKVVGAFHGLSRERSDARRFPAIHPLESWSTYPGIEGKEYLQFAHKILRDGNDIAQMMKVIGEEGTHISDFQTYLKSEYLDSAYIQQDAFHEIDSATSKERQKYVFEKIVEFLRATMVFEGKDAARTFFMKLTQLTKDWNRLPMESDEFKKVEERLNTMVAEITNHA
ncbi:MAG: V-type ATP synthase subunit A [Candidatus Brocadiaceae bacterium]|nr:V-type ATP synthase subunit A [Candidatus Brocadiaceae bacterium]